ncbi:hypothetical protein ES707_13405 [subsurface metagenome]
MGSLDKLFQGLAEGQTPTFLEMMAAISEISNIYPEPEQSCAPTLCLTCG